SEAPARKKGRRGEPRKGGRGGENGSSTQRQKDRGRKPQHAVRSRSEGQEENSSHRSRGYKRRSGGGEEVNKNFSNTQSRNGAPARASQNVAAQPAGGQNSQPQVAGGSNAAPDGERKPSRNRRNRNRRRGNRG